MHALNGNIVGMEDQKDVDAQPSFYSLLGSEAHQPVIDELETLAQMTTQRSTVNTIGSHISENDSIRSDAILADNTNRQNIQIPLPVTDLVPRTYRTAAGALANSGVRLQAVKTHVTDSYIAKAEPSDFSESLGGMVKEQKSSTWRATNTTSNGWNMFDVVQMNSTVTQKDLSMDQALTKLMLLYNIVSSNLQFPQIPKSIYSALDERTNPQGINPILGFNNGPDIFGENCGGAENPVFPFGGGNGVLAFHLTLQSVPVTRRNNAIFVPSTALQGAEEGRRSLAMYVLMFAKWPFCLHTVTKTTTDNAGANEQAQTYIHTENLVSVPGLETLDIVLPRDAAVVNPTNGGQANAVAMVQPSYGSQAAGQGEADALINVSFVGENGVQEINVTDYLCSWALDFSIGDIEQFITRLRYMLPIDRDLYTARQNALMLSTAFPHLIQSNGNGDVQFTPNSTNSIAYSLANLTIPPQTQVDWGLDINVQQTYQLLQTDILAHNKYVLGLFNLPDVITSASLFGWLGHHASFLCGLLAALKVGATHNVFYSSRRMTTQAWDEAYGSQWKGYQHAVYQMFSYNAAQGSLHPAMIDNSMHNLYQHMFDESFPLSTTYYRGSETKFSLFGRWMYPAANGFTTVFWPNAANENAKRNGETPCNLIDAWVYKFANQLPKSFLPWPTPLGQHSTQGYNKAIDPRLIVNWNSSGPNARPFMCRQYDESERLDTSVTVDVHDNTLWNVDLFVAIVGVETVYYDGTDAAINVTPFANFIKQRAMPLNAGAQRPTSTLDACNHTKPLADHNGRLVYLQAPIAGAMNTISAMLRTQQLARAAFRWGHVMRNASIPTDRSGVMDEITKILMKNQGFHSARTTDPAPVQTQSEAARKQMTVETPQSIVQPTQHEVMDTQYQATVSTG
nr:MAG: putative capsid protein [Totiviridae sp.]